MFSGAVRSVLPLNRSPFRIAPLFSLEALRFNENSARFQVYLLHSWHPAANEEHPHLARDSYISVRCDKASRAETWALVVSPSNRHLRRYRRADLQLPSGRLKLPVP